MTITAIQRLAGDMNLVRPAGWQAREAGRARPAGWELSAVRTTSAAPVRADLVDVTAWARGQGLPIEGDILPAVNAHRASLGMPPFVLVHRFTDRDRATRDRIIGREWPGGTKATEIVAMLAEAGIRMTQGAVQQRAATMRLTRPPNWRSETSIAQHLANGTATSQTPVTAIAVEDLLPVEVHADTIVEWARREKLVTGPKVSIKAVNARRLELGLSPFTLIRPPTRPVFT